MIIGDMNTTSAGLQGAVRLDDWGVVRASGADTLGFLNAQLTQALATLPQGQARLAGYCSAKGRLLASFVLWRAGVDECTHRLGSPLASSKM